MNRNIPIPQTYNMRDLGGLPTKSGHMTPYNVFWRGDSPHNTTLHAREILLYHRMTTIIDLRQADECQKHPNPLANDHAFIYVHQPLLMGNLSTAVHNNLQDFYVHILESSKPALATVLRTCATAPAGVFFHCQLGKDRTGIVSALLLLLAGVPESVVIDDYVQTAHNIQPIIAALHAERPPHIAAAAYDELLSAYPSTLRYVLQYIGSTYGDVASYMSAMPLEATDVTRLSQKLRLTHQQ